MGARVQEHKNKAPGKGVWPTATRTFSLACSSERVGTTTTSSPCFQLTGVATECLAVSCRESITRRIYTHEEDLRPSHGADPDSAVQGSNHGLHVCVCLEPGGGGSLGWGLDLRR